MENIIMSELVIVIDSREQQPYTFKKYETVVAGLKTGDYSIQGMEDKVCIERKATAVELFGNISKKRFWNEMTRMEEFPHKCLVCEFSLQDILDYPYNSELPKFLWKKIKIKPPYLISCLMNIQIVRNIPVVFAENKSNALYLTRLMLEKVHKKYDEQ